MILRFTTRTGSRYTLNFHTKRWYRESKGPNRMTTADLQGPLFNERYPKIGQPLRLVYEIPTPCMRMLADVTTRVLYRDRDVWQSAPIVSITQV